MRPSGLCAYVRQLSILAIPDQAQLSLHLTGTAAYLAELNLSVGAFRNRSPGVIQSLYGDRIIGDRSRLGTLEELIGGSKDCLDLDHYIYNL